MEKEFNLNLKEELLAHSIPFREQVNLKDYSTMRIGSTSSLMVEVNSVKDAIKLINITKSFPELKIKVIGDGANTIFVNQFDGLVIKNSIKGRKIVKEDNEHIWITSGAGEDWHELVTYAVENNWAGIENLAFIPGRVGAAPIQNIAAYGQNLDETFYQLEAINLQSGEIQTFNKDQCQFKYRDSIFKNELKDKYLITSVSLCLNKDIKKLETDYHERKGRYGSLEDALKVVAEEPYTIKDVYNAVIYIRKKKLPDPSEIGTCGSFFKNAHVSKEKYLELSEKVEDLQSYPAEQLKYSVKEGEWTQIQDDIVKVPVARLLDELGWKGKWIGNVGISETHALCLVSNGKATSEELFTFIEAVKASMRETYGIELEEEVNVL